MNKIELRPAWRNYWLGLGIVGLLCIASILNLFSAAAPEVGLEVALDAAMGGLAMAAIVFGFVAWKRYSQRYEFDDNRVTQHTGILSKNQIVILISDIRSIEFNQGIIQRLLKVGDLAFYSSGTDSPQVKFVGLLNALDWKEQIDAIRDSIRS